jgi:hypothetical protein
MKLSQAQNFFDNAEVIEYFKASRLKALTPRAGEVALRFIDDPELHSMARQVARQRQTRRPCSYDQNWKFLFQRHSVTPKFAGLE